MSSRNKFRRSFEHFLLSYVAGRWFIEVPGAYGEKDRLKADQHNQSRYFVPVHLYPTNLNSRRKT